MRWHWAVSSRTSNTCRASSGKVLNQIAKFSKKPGPPEHQEAAQDDKQDERQMEQQDEVGEEGADPVVEHRRRRREGDARGVSLGRRALQESGRRRPEVLPVQLQQPMEVRLGPCMDVIPESDQSSVAHLMKSTPTFLLKLGML